METTVTEEDFPMWNRPKGNGYFDALPNVVESGAVSRIVPERARVTALCIMFISVWEKFPMGW